MKIHKKIQSRKLRKSAYDDIGDQIDRITKSLAYLHSQGVDIGEHGREQIERSESVKKRFKKGE